MLYRSWSWLPLAISAVGFFHRSMLVNGDADFESVRTRLTKDHSGKAGDSKDKYFRKLLEAPFIGCFIVLIDMTR